jgi:hypothetical protein
LVVIGQNVNGEKMTKVVHCKKENYDVYIGRPSKWGNPFSHLKESHAQFVVQTRDESIEKYGEWILTQPQLLADLHELRGKILGCWCKPLTCHGDILASLAEKIE